MSTAVKRIRRDEDGTTPATEETTATPDPADDVRVRPVCLPTPGLSFTRECAVVIGWGVTDEGGSVSNTLQEVCFYLLFFIFAITSRIVLQNKSKIRTVTATDAIVIRSSIIMIN